LKEDAVTNENDLGLEESEFEGRFASIEYLLEVTKREGEVQSRRERIGKLTKSNLGSARREEGEEE